VPKFEVLIFADINATEWAGGSGHNDAGVAMRLFLRERMRTATFSILITLALHSSTRWLA